MKNDNASRIVYENTPIFAMSMSKSGSLGIAHPDKQKLLTHLPDNHIITCYNTYISGDNYMRNIIKNIGNAINHCEQYERNNQANLSERGVYTGITLMTHWKT